MNGCFSATSYKPVDQIEVSIAVLDVIATARQYLRTARLTRAETKTVSDADSMRFVYPIIMKYYIL